jgi:hypothetical protein
MKSKNSPINIRVFKGPLALTTLCTKAYRLFNKSSFGKLGGNKETLTDL